MSVLIIGIIYTIFINFHVFSLIFVPSFICHCLSAFYSFDWTFILFIYLSFLVFELYIYFLPFLVVADEFAIVIYN
jgi:hypothetical protein